MNYYLPVATNNKAKNDIDAILADMGYKRLTPLKQRNKGWMHFGVKLLAMCRILLTLRRGDRLFLQYPLKKFYHTACLLAHLKGAKVVAVIHDLGAFRRHKLTFAQENRRLAQTDFLIVHNDAMKAHLLRHGCKVPMHTLKIFDYLSDATPADYPTPHQPWRIVYAGGLGRRKNAFLYQLDKLMDNWSLDIYGRGFEEEEAGDAKQLRYCGFKDSERFIAETEADFGLVWDGDSTDECAGNWGEYLKINNPHKTSFYLRSGMPVIVWRQAAMASFVRERQIGVCVERLADLTKALGELTPDRYAVLKQNARQMGTLLGEGHFIKQGIEEAFMALKNS